MKRTLLAVLDRLFCILIGTFIALAVMCLAEPWDADVIESIEAHEQVPLDVNDSIIVRCETADGVEMLPPKVMPLWKYVWEPQSELDMRIGNFEQVADVLLNDPEMQGHLERHGVDGDEQAVLRATLGVE